MTIHNIEIQIFKQNKLFAIAKFETNDEILKDQFIITIQMLVNEFNLKSEVIIN